jgi:hypothetical protein
MKKAINIILFILAMAIIAVGFGWRVSMHSVPVQVKVEALPEEGLIIIGPSDQAFNEEVAHLLKGMPDELREYIETARPFCVILKNGTNQRVIASSFRWQIKNGDGSLSVKTQSYAAPGSLMGMGEATADAQANTWYSVAPHSSHFFSLDASLTNLLNTGISKHDWSSKETRQQITDFLERAKSNSKSREPSISGVTVSLDAAIFNDGTFVGPDNNRLLPRLQGQINARRDLYQMVADKLNNRESPDSIFKQIESLTKKPGVRPSGALTEKDYYDFAYDQSLKIFANELLKQGKSEGTEGALTRIQRQLQNAWVGIKRKDSQDSNWAE